jgi:hypothetical protein
VRACTCACASLVARAANRCSLPSADGCARQATASTSAACMCTTKSTC